RIAVLGAQLERRLGLCAGAGAGLPDLRAPDDALLPRHAARHHAMRYPDALMRWIVRGYLALFLAYLLFPLGYMSLLAFTDSRIPTHQHFQFTLKWFGEAWEDDRMWDGLEVSLMIAVLVVIMSVILGLGGAMTLVRLQIRAKSLLYSVLVSPILAPGIVLGISTFIFWSQQIGFHANWWTAAFGQSGFI